MKVAVGDSRRFDTRAPLAEVFTLLADVPRSVGHFPDIERLVPLGDNVYRWELRPVGIGNFEHRVVYASRYVDDADRRGLSWTPVDGVGNGIIRGRWRLEERDRGTTLDFAVDGELDLPAPAPLRPMLAPFVQRHFRQQVQRYLDNLHATLEG